MSTDKTKQPGLACAIRLLTSFDTTSESLRIPLTLHLSNRTIPVNALLDTGAQGLFLHKDFASKHKIPLLPLKKSIKPKNTDGTVNTAGLITHYAILYAHLGSDDKQIRIAMKFLVTAIDNEDIILGLPWFKTHRPQFDWENGCVWLRRTTVSTRLAQQARAKKLLEAPKTALEKLVPKEYHEFLSLFDEQKSFRFPPV